MEKLEMLKQHIFRFVTLTGEELNYFLSNQIPIRSNE